LTENEQWRVMHPGNWKLFRLGELLIDLWCDTTELNNEGKRSYGWFCFVQVTLLKSSSQYLTYLLAISDEPLAMNINRT
jgi:hypothetical protein